jgi:hypothetical protein
MGAGPNSAYFAYRAAHYRLLAALAPNEKIATAQLALANMFLQMCDERLRIELAGAQLAEEGG